MKIEILSKIKKPSDVKKLSSDELVRLADEIRYKLIETVSENGGHLAPNLGVVELTLAMHKVFDSPKDQFVFDVGHQCYTHKLLTGRYESFSTLRTKGGISGFCRPSESEHDTFFSGHSSTSVSAGLGLAEANLISKKDNYVITVIGDGSFTGGMVYEALNNGGRSEAKQIIILNDNKMSISENVGAFAKYLAVIRSRPGYYTFKANTEKVLNKFPFGEKIAKEIYNIKTDIKNKIYKQSTFFEDLGYRYMGPIDGHDIENLCDALESAKNINGPVLLHVITVKGKGYGHAEKSPSQFHGISRFDIETGEPISNSESFSSKFGDYLCEHAKEDKSICAVTAAMGLGTGLDRFSKEYSERFFDVGIAEEHAVTFSSGLAKNGMKPIYAVYSTFLQRCYDQIVHDVSLQKLKVIFAIDRAGFVGEDGETHHGLFDVPFLNTIPDITVYSPCCYKSLYADLSSALYADEYGVAVRYPRGTASANVSKLKFEDIDYSYYGEEAAEKLIVTYGRIADNAVSATDALENTALVVLNRIKPVPEKAFEIIRMKKEVYFFEEGLKSGGVAEKLGAMLIESGFTGKYVITAVRDEFVRQASIADLLEEYSLDVNSMIKTVSGEKD
ncbi:MAG: 1-deoxy-D-xylulose-5-phosphate synthase [Ruminococcaceae bacterium]|nr:1-deoxy-D-xylulose-5-phosphate synthase [Oscillospiraceae bacterium]